MNLNLAGIIIVIEKMDEEHDYIWVLDARTYNADKIAKISHGAEETIRFVTATLTDLLNKPVSNQVDAAGVPKDVDGWIRDFEKRGIK